MLPSAPLCTAGWSPIGGSFRGSSGAPYEASTEGSQMRRVSRSTRATEGTRASALAASTTYLICGETEGECSSEVSRSLPEEGRVMHPQEQELES